MRETPTPSKRCQKLSCTRILQSGHAYGRYPCSSCDADQEGHPFGKKMNHEETMFLQTRATTECPTIPLTGTSCNVSPCISLGGVHVRCSCPQHRERRKNVVKDKRAWRHNPFGAVEHAAKSWLESPAFVRKSDLFITITPGPQSFRALVARDLFHADSPAVCSHPSSSSFLNG